MSLAMKAARARTQGGRSGVVQEGGFLDFLKGVAGVAISTVTGGPLAGARTAVRSISGGGGRAPQLPPPRFAPAPGVRAGVERALPGGATGLMQIACPSGWHPNKSDYFLKSGELVLEGSRCVKNRRRNPMNPRALDRAIGRVDSGKRLQHKLAAITTAKYTSAGHRKDHHHG